MIRHLRAWLARRRDRRRLSLREDAEARRRAERDLHEQERRLAEERLRLESRSQSPW
ncbi:MAG TPA: hypothetical protein VE644_00365 [Gaiellaceae bacterium]|jgi:hypothetical protein|nr:hypothetical protein [Gaiellaceae bacterium]